MEISIENNLEEIKDETIIETNEETLSEENIQEIDEEALKIERINQGISNAIALIPEIEDYPYLMTKKMYEICDKVHGNEEEELLRYYLLAYLLTMEDELDFSHITISNIVLEGDNENIYLKKYKKLKELILNELPATIGIV